MIYHSIQSAGYLSYLILRGTQKTNPDKKFLPIFNGRINKSTIYGRRNAVLDEGHIILVKWRAGTFRYFKNTNHFLVICSSFSFVRQCGTAIFASAVAIVISLHTDLGTHIVICNYAVILLLT